LNGQDNRILSAAVYYARVFRSGIVEYGKRVFGAQAKDISDMMHPLRDIYHDPVTGDAAGGTIRPVNMRHCYLSSPGGYIEYPVANVKKERLSARSHPVLKKNIRYDSYDCTINKSSAGIRDPNAELTPGFNPGLRLTPCAVRIKRLM